MKALSGTVEEYILAGPRVQVYVYLRQCDALATPFSLLGIGELGFDA